MLFPDFKFYKSLQMSDLLTHIVKIRAFHSLSGNKKKCRKDPSLNDLRNKRIEKNTHPE